MVSCSLNSRLKNGALSKFLTKEVGFLTYYNYVPDRKIPPSQQLKNQAYKKYLAK